MPEGPEGIDKLALVGGALCLDFVNTVHDYSVPEPTDELGSMGDLVDWAQKAGTLASAPARRLRELAEQHPVRAAASLEGARTVRATIYKIFTAVAEGRAAAAADLDALRRAWAAALDNAQLTPAGDAYQVEWKDGAVDFDGVVWPVVQSAIELLTSGEATRTRGCGGTNCTWLFVDRSKNRSRRWCQMDVCGNRAKARRHYRRAQS